MCFASDTSKVTAETKDVWSKSRSTVFKMDIRLVLRMHVEFVVPYVSTACMRVFNGSVKYREVVAMAMFTES